MAYAAGTVNPADLTVDVAASAEEAQAAQPWDADMNQLFQYGSFLPGMDFFDNPNFYDEIDRNYQLWVTGGPAIDPALSTIEVPPGTAIDPAIPTMEGLPGAGIDHALPTMEGLSCGQDEQADHSAVQFFELPAPEPTVDAAGLDGLDLSSVDWNSNSELPQGDISQGDIFQGNIPQGDNLQGDIQNGDVLQGDILLGGILQDYMAQCDIPDSTEPQSQGSSPALSDNGPSENAVIPRRQQLLAPLVPSADYERITPLPGTAPSLVGHLLNLECGRSFIQKCINEPTRLITARPMGNFCRASHVYVFREGDGMKRWTDNVQWGPSRQEKANKNTADTIFVYQERTHPKQQGEDDRQHIRRYGLVKKVLKQVVDGSSYVLVAYSRITQPQPPASTRATGSKRAREDDSVAQAPPHKRQLLSVSPETDEEKKTIFKELRGDTDGINLHGKSWSGKRTDRKGMAPGYKQIIYKQPCMWECGHTLKPGDAHCSASHMQVL